jgi:hypothetical protein
VLLPRLRQHAALPRPEPNERVLNQSEGVNEIITVTETPARDGGS